MEVDTSAENSINNETEGQFTGQFYQDCLATLGGAAKDAAMVLDDCGEVLFCNSKGAAVFHSTADKLAGKHLSEFVINIRLNAWTPGSNVAYATFIGRRNQWREYCAFDPAGQGFSVELLLDVLVVNLRYLILLWARTPASPAAFPKQVTTGQSPGVKVSDRYCAANPA